MVKESDQKANDEKVSSQIDGKTEAEQFNLEEELATQIDVNLGLREEIDSMNQELDSLKLIDQKNRAEINLLEDDKAELHLKYLQQQDSSNDEIEVLKEKMGYLEESLGKKEENTRQIVEEKEKRILELEEEGYSMNHQILERQKDH